MKKKVFSKLLMVALVATVGAFTSCKDYDDDINDLRSQINGLETSLTTLVNDKVTTVSQKVTQLEQQLKEVETAYAQADEALKAQLKTAEETGKANAETIKTLQAEVVNLQTAKGQLEVAIKALQEGLATANENIKANGNEIIKLVAADKALEDKIAVAQAAAENALKEAQAAKAKADENATAIGKLETKEQADFENLQKQISDNLNTVNAKIADVNTTLSEKISTNASAIKTLQDASTEYKSDIKSIKDKVTALENSDKAILEALEKAQTKLEAADTKIVDDQKKVNDQLIEKIKANYDAIELINQTTIPNLIRYTIPEEVEKQLNAVLTERLKTFFENDVKTLVATETGKNKTLIEALDAKVDSLDEAINKYVDAQFVIVAATMDSIASAHDIKAGQIIDAYKAADTKLWAGIDSIGDLLEDAKTKLSGDIATINATIGKASSDDAAATGMFAQIESLESWFNLAEGQEEGGLLKYQEELLKTQAFKDAMQEIVDAANNEIMNMITSINLFAGPHEDYHSDQDGTGYDEFDHHLLFTYAIEKQNVFPNAAGQKFTADSLEFTEGKFRSYSDTILVRVSPVDAILTKDNIALLNSQGENIVGADEVIEVVDVRRYNRPGEYLTRGEKVNTGLWVIEVKLNDSKIAEKFEKAAYTGEDNVEQILYAVAAKNTEANRYVVSEYDLDLNTAEAYHAWDFDVNDLTVANIHNRYAWTEDGPGYSKVQTDDVENASGHVKTFVEEKTYVDATNQYAALYQNECRLGTIRTIDGEKEMLDYPAFTYAQLDENEDGNVTNRYRHTTIGAGGYGTNGIDNRHDFAILNAGFNYVDEDGKQWAKIDIEFPSLVEGCDKTKPVAGFYVTLDQEFAKESNSSEVNAWVNYIYKNVGYYYVHNGKLDTSRGDEGYVKGNLFKGNTGSIFVKDANNVKGDIIGFRVYAVNLDGTLYDPDGRAFYVRIGEKVDDQKLTFHVVAETTHESWNIQDTIEGGKNPIIEYNASENNELPFFNIEDDIYTYVEWEWADKNPVVRSASDYTQAYQPEKGSHAYLPTRLNINGDPLFQFLYTEDAEITEETEWSTMPTAKTQNVKCIILQADRLLDNETYYLKAVINQVDNGGTFIATLNTINVEVTKLMPTELPSGFKVRVGQEAHAKDVNFYLRPWRAQYSWRIFDWFDPTATEEGENYGAGSLIPAAVAAGTAGEVWSEWEGKWPFIIDDQQPIYIEPVLKAPGRPSSDIGYNYRWATDVRPYNFEEIFVGLVEEQGTSKVYDKNYVFVFPGCGDVGAKVLRGNEDLTGDAVTEYKMYRSIGGPAASSFKYTGVLADKSNTTTQDPGYYLPFVKYNVIDQYNADKKLAVKAGYIYRAISFTLDEDGEVNLENDYTLKPQYFDVNGRFVKDATKAAFQCYFTCAIDKNFSTGIGVKITELTLDGVAKTYTDATNPNAGKKAAKIGTESDNTIPYGMGFSVELDSIGATWTSNLAALTTWGNDGKAWGASYFKTNFNQFTSDFTKGTALSNNGVSYYTDTVAVNGANLRSDNYFLYDVKNKYTSRTKADWIAIVDVTDPLIAKVELDVLKADGTKQETKDITKQVGEYFIITYYNENATAGSSNKFGIKVTPNTSALDPTKIGQIRFTLKSTAKMVHQWGHTVDVKNGNGFTVYYGKPYSTPNLSRANRR